MLSLAHSCLAHDLHSHGALAATWPMIFRRESLTNPGMQSPVCSHSLPSTLPCGPSRHMAHGPMLHKEAPGGSLK